jgi:hypothetical protein
MLDISKLFSSARSYTRSLATRFVHVHDAYASDTTSLNLQTPISSTFRNEVIGTAAAVTMVQPEPWRKPAIPASAFVRRREYRHGLVLAVGKNPVSRDALHARFPEAGTAPAPPPGGLLGPARQSAVTSTRELVAVPFDQITFE